MDAVVPLVPGRVVQRVIFEERLNKGKLPLPAGVRPEEPLTEGPSVIVLRILLKGLAHNAQLPLDVGLGDERKDGLTVMPDLVALGVIPGHLLDPGEFFFQVCVDILDDIEAVIPKEDSSISVSFKLSPCTASSRAHSTYQIV
jgi:hypothetical protein